MFRLELHLAYTGSYFAGWQVQPGQRTVQGCLEKVFNQLCQEFIRVHGAGRTDAGVHALDQVAHVDIPAGKKGIPWQKALNSLLPTDVAVTKVKQVSQDFHARFNALGKEYLYILWTNTDYVLPQRRPFVWPVGRLDQESMFSAAQYLHGEHDFSAFQNVGTLIKNPVRNLYYIKKEQGDNPYEMVWRFYANGFLKQMVRNMIGLLVQVGRERIPVQDVQTLMEGKDRTLLPATAPAQGLCLNKVDYF